MSYPQSISFNSLYSPVSADNFPEPYFSVFIRRKECQILVSRWKIDFSGEPKEVNRTFFSADRTQINAIFRMIEKRDASSPDWWYEEVDTDIYNDPNERFFWSINTMYPQHFRLAQAEGWVSPSKSYRKIAKAIYKLMVSCSAEKEAETFKWLWSFPYASYRDLWERYAPQIEEAGGILPDC